jgi:hypothetical protein
VPIRREASLERGERIKLVITGTIEVVPGKSEQVVSALIVTGLVACRMMPTS